MGFDIGDIVLPDYESFKRSPRNNNCPSIDTKRIIGEILGGEHRASNEVKESFKGEEVLIEGQYAIVLRYKREKDDNWYPSMVMGFDIDNDGGIIIRHIQGTKQKKISFRFSSSFDSTRYFIEFIKENFTQKGLSVTLPDVPTNLEGASYAANSIQMYDDLRQKLENLNSSIK